jgi:hypothetical protein
VPFGPGAKEEEPDFAILGGECQNLRRTAILALSLKLHWLHYNNIRDSATAENEKITLQIFRRFVRITQFL